eukprot:1321998-Rhodomonas_salina.1
MLLYCYAMLGLWSPCDSLALAGSAIRHPPTVALCHTPSSYGLAGSAIRYLPTVSLVVPYAILLPWHPLLPLRAANPPTILQPSTALLRAAAMLGCYDATLCWVSGLHATRWLSLVVPYTSSYRYAPFCPLCCYRSAP